MAPLRNLLLQNLSLLKFEASARDVEILSTIIEYPNALTQSWSTIDVE